MSSRVPPSKFRNTGNLFLAVMLLALCMTGRVFGLGADTMQSMVIVSGDEGSGSGFVVKMGDKLYVITNSHVIRGNKNLKFKNLSNQELTVGPLEIADHADLVRAEITGKVSFLTIAQNVEKSLQIGDAVVVAGNSEGEGVVREIPGKVTGIGPDRIEVDAGFVPGNSGSPILLKSTGQVIGVATYLKIPRSLRGSTKSELSLNEVRRFGYRPDTVAKWILPTTQDRIMKEGMKLAELEQTMAVVIALLNSGTSALSRFGSGAYITKERLAANPGLANLATALDDFTTAVTTTKDPAKAKENVIKLFEAIKVATMGDIDGYKEEFFSGYFAQQFKDQLQERKALSEALDKMITMANKNPDFFSGPVNPGSAAPVDVSKLNFPLKDEIYTNNTQQKAHRVGYPVEAKPENTENLFWVEETPDRGVRVVPMRNNFFRLSPKDVGLYKVRIEYRSAGMIKKVSNEVELNLTGVAQAPEANDGLGTADIIGHDAGGQPFRDVGADNGVLVGFEIVIGSFKDSQEVVRGVAPVYQGSKGETKGLIYGGQKGSRTQRLVAKAGYAVGKITVQSVGPSIRCMKVRFDRIKNNVLDSTDNYEEPWVGVFPDAMEQEIDLKGKLPRGMMGRAGLGLNSMAVLYLKQ